MAIELTVQRVAERHSAKSPEPTFYTSQIPATFHNAPVLAWGYEFCVRIYFYRAVIFLNRTLYIQYNGNGKPPSHTKATTFDRKEFDTILHTNLPEILAWKF